jgi:hypothetical protein
MFYIRPAKAESKFSQAGQSGCETDPSPAKFSPWIPFDSHGGIERPQTLAPTPWGKKLCPPALAPKKPLKAANGGLGAPAFDRDMKLEWAA